MIFVSGCSFLRHNNIDQILHNRFQRTDVINVAAPGAGNAYITDSVINAVMHSSSLTHPKYRQEIDYVFVLLSGIIRHDILFGKNVVETYVADDYTCKSFGTNYSFVHSGGMSGAFDEIGSKDMTKYFQLYYKEYAFTGLDLFTTQTKKNLFAMKAVLDAHNIPHDIGFIYDPAGPLGGSNGPCEGLLGQATDDLSTMYNIKTYPFEYCKERNQLDVDNFHPTEEGFVDWLNSVTLKID